MSCKKNKWWPHNWFCLKGLYWIFVVLFYIVLAFVLWNIGQMIYVAKTNPAFTGALFWETFVSFSIQAASFLLGLLTVSVILKALHKIVHAVAPCCCQDKKEEVVVVKSEK